MSPGSSTDSYPAFARIGLRENPGKNLNQVTFPDRDSNPGHLVSRPDALTVTPQVWTNSLAVPYIKRISANSTTVNDSITSSAAERTGTASYDGWINFENEMQDRQEWRNAVCEREGKDSGFSYDLLDGTRTTFRGMVLRDQPGECCRRNGRTYYEHVVVSAPKIFFVFSFMTLSILTGRIYSEGVIELVQIVDVKMELFNVTRKLREELRNAELESWKIMPGRGRGVELYSQVPEANAWIFNKSGVSKSEWVTCLKMNANLAAVRGVPGRSLDGSRCRHGWPETETLAHVQGQCNRGLLLRNARHHHVRSLIATALRKKSWIVEEEVFCLATNGSSRCIDIIAYSQTTKKGYIIDPTIRIETGSSQPEDANQEKINIYLPTVDYFKAKYQLEDIEVIGLLIGARGVIPKFFESFRKTFELPQTLTADIITSVLKRSCQILSHHIHSV
ncbi:hypothetical protein ANN_15063 [Periplaneta americana]|uniref:Uncharacterized protein n=1 Tax=Periplaneta americana TaxID=6978 RepID=A0ABQ8SY51_PERAM|nr:hypothetical protein ANN_15063 [Periplaneta americana]